MTEQERIIVCTVLEKTGIDSISAARILLDINECFGNSIKRIREGIRLGFREIERQEHSVPFYRAVEESIESKRHRRKRTLADIRQLTNRLMRCNEGLRDRSLRSLSVNDCRQIIERAFTTSRQKLKARSVLSGIFSVGRKRGWCTENPMISVDIPIVRENEVPILSIRELKKLLAASRKTDCAAAVGLMVFAGIRPKEVERLTWGDIDLDEKSIRLRPSHTKTGGIRHVTIQDVLYKWIVKECTRRTSREDEKICPKNWAFKWTMVRHKAGFIKWQQDCLRHTYASYHAKYFRDFSSLQLEMGHSSSTLLRTRYLNMRGITQEGARMFWSGEFFAAM